MGSSQNNLYKLIYIPDGKDKTMSNLAGKVDVKNMMKGDEKDTTGNKDKKKDKAMAKGLNSNTVEKEKVEKENKGKKKEEGGNIKDKESKTQGEMNVVRKDVDLNNVQKMSELLEDYNFLGGDQVSEFDVMFIKK